MRHYKLSLPLRSQWLALTTPAIVCIWTLIAPAAFAQANAWLKNSSGNWEEPQWSLGTLPGPGQNVLITNAGWKSVMISATTSQSYPQTLSVNSVTISSPPDSFNSLFLNYAGAANPLVVNSITVASNSAAEITMSGLRLNGPTGVGLSLGGTFTQGAGSLVTGNQMDVGWLGPGRYTLADGYLALSAIWVGGPHSGVFVQDGGINDSGIVHLEAGGTYLLRGGLFGADDVYFSGNNSTFRQQGGEITNRLAIYIGSYFLEGGVNSGGIVPGIYSYGYGNALVVQTGGTNTGSVSVGNVGNGSYVLSNGVSQPPAISVGGRGSLTQYGGTQITSGSVRTVSDYVDRNYMRPGTIHLSGGEMGCGNLQIGGVYSQSGGTNHIQSGIDVYGSLAAFYLNDGLLTAGHLTVSPSWAGAVEVNGGRLLLSGDLDISDTYSPFSRYNWLGFRLLAGELAVSNIFLRADARFTKTSGKLSQTGTIVSEAGQLIFGPGPHHLGPLNLQTASELKTNTTLDLTRSNSCAVFFRDSRAQPWSPEARLVISNWVASPTGGGFNKVYFGDDSAAVTSIQLSQILFINPVGRAAGTYTAAILATGEVVASDLPPTGRTPPNLQLTRLPDATIQITLRGDVGATYAVERSTDLATWDTWTNALNQNGTLTFLDISATNYPQRFYRGLLLP